MTTVWMLLIAANCCTILSFTLGDDYTSRLALCAISAICAIGAICLLIGGAA